MSAQIKKEQTWILAAVCLAVFVVSGLGGLGIVWMRQQITNSATQVVKLESQLMHIDRRSVYMKAQIAQLDNPASMRGQVVSKLIHPKHRQIVWLDDTKVRLHRDLENDLLKKGIVLVTANDVNANKLKHGRS